MFKLIKKVFHVYRNKKNTVIEQVLKEDNEGTLLALETVFKKAKKPNKKKLTIYDFVGILTKKTLVL